MAPPLILRLLNVLFVFALATTSNAQSAAAQEAELDRLMAASGINAEFARMAGTLQRGLDEASEDSRALDAAAVARLHSAIASAYAGDLLQAETRRQLRETLPAADVTAALTWVESPVGRRLRALEEIGEAEEAAMMSTEFIKAEQKAFAALPEGRQAILKRLAKVSYAAEGAADTITSIMLGNLIAMARTAPPGTFNLNEAKAKLTAQHARLASELTPVVLGSFGAVYHAATDDDLNAYIAFAESPVGDRFSVAVRAATNKAMTAAAIRFAQEVIGDAGTRASAPHARVASGGIRAVNRTARLVA
jgi:hypothetical protein